MDGCSGGGARSGAGGGVQGAPIIRCGSRAVPLIEHMPTTW